jgi:hypothetical protein
VNTIAKYHSAPLTVSSPSGTALRPDHMANGKHACFFKCQWRRLVDVVNVICVIVARALATAAGGYGDGNGGAV